jgi:hypothetical protein
MIPFTVVFVIRTGSDTDGTVGIHAYPEFEAFFTIDGPLGDALMAGKVRRT